MRTGGRVAAGLLAAALAGCGGERPAAPPAPPGLTLPDRFVARGTEPFWAATVAGGTLTYATPEHPAGTRLPVVRQAAGDAVIIRGKLHRRPLILVVTRGPCSDGMSDLAYPYAVRRSLGDDVQRGCAAVR